MAGVGWRRTRRPESIRLTLLAILGAVAVALASTQVAGAAPANDSFSSPQTLSGWSGSTTGTNAGATAQNREPIAPGGASRTVWYRWTAPSSGVASIDTLGSDFDTVVSVFTGTRVDRLTLVAQNDNSTTATTVFGRTSRVTFNAAAGVTYSVQVDGMYYETGTIRLAWNRPPPPNDAFAGATTLSGSSGTVTGSNLLATGELGEPRHGGVGYGASIWYRWTAPATGTWRFDTRSSEVQSTVVAAYTGSAVNALIPAGRDCASYDYRCVEVQVTGGQVVQIAVDGTAGQYQGNVTLHWEPLPTPPNDAFAAAQAISGGSGSAAGTTVGATVEPGEPSGQRTVWFRYVAPWPGLYSFAVTATSGEPAVGLWRGASVSALTAVPGTFDEYYDPAWDLTAGATYFIRVDGRQYPASFTLTWRKLPPENDDPDGATYLRFDAPITQTTAGATKYPGEANHAGEPGGASVWFGFSPPAAGTLTLDTAGSDFDTVLAVYAGGVPVASDDDSGGGGASRVTLRLYRGIGYSVAVDGVGGAVGNLRLTASFTPERPANDDFASAAPIATERAYADGTLIAATIEPGEPADAADGGHSVWYQWVAPATGRVEFDTWYLDWWWYYAYPPFDARLAVYTGSSLGTLRLVGRDDPAVNDSRVSVPIVRGNRYWIAVDGRSGVADSFRLSWSVGPPNDEFESPQVLTGWTGSVSGSTAGATWQLYDDDGTPGDDDFNGNVWFLWRAPATGDVAFTARDSSNGAFLRVYEGPNLFTAGWVVASDGNGRAAFHAVGGTVYRISLLADGPGAYELAWAPASLPPPVRPPNDDLANATPLSGASGSLAEEITNATVEPYEPAHDPEEIGYASVWFRWTAPFTGQVTFDTTGSDYLTILAAYDDAGVGFQGLAQIVENVNQLTYGATTLRLGVTAGTTYTLAVARAPSYLPGNHLALAWRPTTAPANDNVAGAEPIAGASGSVTESNAAASRESQEPHHAGAAGGASLWYAWTAPASGPVAFMTQTTLDTVLAAYRRGPDGTLQLVAENDDQWGPYASRVRFVAGAGTTYYVAWDTCDAWLYHVDGTRGSATLSWRQPPSPANDAFANATSLNPGGYSAYYALVSTDDTYGATKEPGEPAHAGNAGGASVWYRWHYSESWPRSFTIDTVGSSFDTLVGVYQGSSVSALTPVASDDDSGGSGASLLTFSVSAPGDYWIAVDGKNGVTGEFVLSLAPSEAPANDDFRARRLLTGASGSVTVSTYGATSEPGEPSPFFAGPDQTVWYRWTAPTTGTWRFSTTSSSVLGVYTGDAVDSLLMVAGGDESVVYAAVVAGQTYAVQVDAAGYEPGSTFTLAWTQSQAPPNDHFAQPLVLAGTSGSVTQSTVGASVEPGEPLHAGSVGGASLWYAWTAPFTGTMQLDTRGSSFDTVLAVYTGDSLATLREVRSNDDFADLTASLVRFEARAGTRYLVAVDGSAGWPPGPTGDVTLRWSLAVPPANDAFAAAAALAGSSGSAAGTTVGARTESREPQHGERVTGASVWYAWTAGASGNETVSVPAGFVVGVYAGTDVGSLAVVRRSDDTGDESPSVTFAASAGTTYRIAVDSLLGDAGPFTLAWSGGAPDNDAFAAPRALVGPSGTTVVSTVGATKEPDEPSHAGDAGGASVWFDWVAPANGVAGFDTAGSSFDTLLAVYRGTELAGLTAVAASRTGAVRFEAVAGETYRIAVDGSGGATGDVVLDWYPSPAPPNDDRGDAALIGGRDGYVTGTTLGATAESGEAAGARSVWFAWTAPANGTVTFTAPLPAFDAVLAVYRGSMLVVQRDDPAASATSVSFAAVAGATYDVALYGAGGSAGGYTLTWREPPPNDDLANAQPIAGAAGSVTGTTAGAGLEPAEGYGSDRSIWYRWTAPATGTYVFDTAGSASPHTVSASRGTAYGAFSGPGTARFGAVAGDVFSIAVRVSSWYEPGDVALSWRLATDAPANDLFVNAQTVAGGTGSAATPSAGASLEAGEAWPGDGNRSVWFRWVAPASGRAWISSRGSDGDSGLDVYTGASLAALSAVAPSSSYYPYHAVGFDALAGTAYSIRVTTYGGSAAVTWYLDGQAGPPAQNAANDMFANAWTISGDTQSTVWTTAATKEPGEPNHAGNAGGHSVWWTWTAPATARAVINTESSNFNTLLAVYRGSSVSALTLVAANDDNGSTVGSSTVGIDVTAGTTYRIAVDGKNGVTGQAVLRIGTSSPADTTPPSTTIGSGPTSPTSSPTATFLFWASDTAARFECRLDGGAWLTCTSPVQYTGLAAGTHAFAVRAIDPAGNVDSVGASRSWVVASRPGNDMFASAATLSGLTGLQADATIGATRESGEPLHDFYDGGAGSVWYRWTAPRNGFARFWVDWSDFWGSSAVYTGDAVSALQQVPYLEDGTFRAAVGTTYAVAVAGPLTGSFKLRWREAPPNDGIEHAEPLAGPSGAWSGDNVAATKTPDEPAHGGDPGGASVWLEWTAPASGTLTVDTLGSDPALSTLLAVYTRVAAGYPTLRAQDRDSAGGGKSRVQLEVFQGTAYLFAVDGVGGATGALHVSWGLTAGIAPPPPDPPAPSGSSPTVTLTAPADGAHVSGIVTVSATASDPDGIDRVEFIVGGFTIGFDRDAPYSYEWATSSHGEGPVDVVARAVDRTGATALSTPHVVSADNTGPYVTIESGPYAYGPTATTFARFVFRSEPGASFACSLDEAALAACVSPVDYLGVSAGPHRFTVRVTDAFGSVGQTQTWSWTAAAPAETTPPDTAIAAGPSGTTADSGATFVFTATENGSFFECRLDGVAFVGCTTPLELQNLPAGAHTLEVRAIDPSGNVDATPAARSWTISGTAPPPGDTTPPETTIDSGPSGTVSALDATFAFSSTESGSTFRCRLDTPDWTPCTSPKTYTALATGSHTFSVVATDGAGNDDPTPATRTWTIASPADTTPPETTIDSGPSGTTTGATASFSFSSSEAGSTFQCRLDGAAFAACTSPTSYSALATGAHTFEVRASDAAGNTDPSPASRTWTISAPTSNDAFANATAISGSSGTAGGSTVGMTKEAGEPNHAGNAGGHSIWYRWTAPSAGTVTVDTIGSSFDTLLAVYTGSSVSALALVAQNDDASGVQSRVTFAAVASTSYSVAVDGYGGATGSVTLHWNLAASSGGASNDMFSAAAAPTGSAGTWTGSTAGATKEAGEPNHAGNAGGHSVWFAWTAPAAGATTFKTTGSSFDTLLAVYTGSAVSSLTAVASNDDADGTLQSRVTFTAAAGTTYRVAVDGYAGASGSVVLGWSQP